MSHFSTIKTKLKDKSIIIECLNRMGERVNNPADLGMSVVDLVITNPSHAEEHPTTEYELIADRQTWKKDIPIERFLEKLTQQYARLTVHDAIEEQGFQLQEEWEMDDNTIEITATRWVE